MADGLLNKASIILTPTGYKAGTLYNVAPIDEPYEDFDFARTSTATRINSSGLVSNVATGVPRINYDSNGDNGHILLEPTSTNLITYSEDFSQTSFWNANSDILTPVKSTTIAAPDGSYNAWHIVKDGTTAPKVASSVPGSTSTEYTKSIWARTISGTGTAYFGEGQFSGDGVLTTVTTEWQRIEITVTQENFYAVDFRGSSTLTEVLIWGAQMEQLSYATSYIPTLTGSTVTRATETLTGSGNSTLINSREGVLYAEIAALRQVNDNVQFLAINSSSYTQNSIYIQLRSATNQIGVWAYSNGSNEVAEPITLTDITAFNKIAIRWKVNDFNVFINGTSVFTDTSYNAPTSNSLNTLEFARGGASNIYCKCKALAVFNDALSDAELNNLTG